MPWEHCGRSVRDDQVCPGCGLTKAQWTVQWDQTRTFTMARKPGKSAEFLRLRLIDAEGDELGGEAYEVELPDGARVQGTLDDYGYAKVPLTQTGECKVRFPERGDDTWERVTPSGGGAGTSPGAGVAGGGEVHTFRGWDYAVILELDDDPASVASSRYRLTSDQGYDVTKTLKDNRAGGGGIELLFNVPSPEAAYSCHVDPEGTGAEVYPIFEHVPYPELEAGQAPGSGAGPPPGAFEDEDDDGPPPPDEDPGEWFVLAEDQLDDLREMAGEPAPGGDA